MTLQPRQVATARRCRHLTNTGSRGVASTTVNRKDLVTFRVKILVTFWTGAPATTRWTPFTGGSGVGLVAGQGEEEEGSAVAVRRDFARKLIR